MLFSLQFSSLSFHDFTMKCVRHLLQLQYLRQAERSVTAAAWHGALLPSASSVQSSPRLQNSQHQVYLSLYTHKHQTLFTIIAV